MLLSSDLLFHLSCLMFLHYLGKHEHEPRKLSFQLCCISFLENDTALACYIFHMHQPILIILLQTIRSYYQVQCANIISRLATFCFRDTVCSMAEKTMSGVHVSPGSTETLHRKWDNKSPFDSILSQQRLCQKLVDLHRKYTVLHQCRFSQTQRSIKSQQLKPT